MYYHYGKWKEVVLFSEVIIGGSTFHCQSACKLSTVFNSSKYSRTSVQWNSLSQKIHCIVSRKLTFSLYFIVAN